MHAPLLVIFRSFLMWMLFSRDGHLLICISVENIHTTGAKINIYHCHLKIWNKLYIYIILYCTHTLWARFQIPIKRMVGPSVHVALDYRSQCLPSILQQFSKDPRDDHVRLLWYCQAFCLQSTTGILNSCRKYNNKHEILETYIERIMNRWVLRIK